MSFTFSITDLSSDLWRDDLEALKADWGMSSKLAQYSQRGKGEMLSSWLSKLRFHPPTWARRQKPYFSCWLYSKVMTLRSLRKIFLSMKEVHVWVWRTFSDRIANLCKSKNASQPNIRWVSSWTMNKFFWQSWPFSGRHFHMDKLSSS